MKQRKDDHLPPPVKPAKGGDIPAPSPEDASAFPWVDRLLFTGAGLLLGFAMAYVYLEKVPTPFSQGASGNPHAGIPGAPQDAGSSAAAAAPMPVDPATRQKLQELQQTLAQNPNDYDLLVRVGNAAYDANDFRTAADAYERALKVKGDDPNVLTDLGISYRNIGDPNKAIELFDRAIKASPGHWQARFNKVVVLGLDKGDKQGALALLGELKKERAQHPELPPIDKLEEALNAK